jgi:hypothetical protein
MTAQIQRTMGPQPVKEHHGEFTWSIPLSAAPSREWLKFFNTPPDLGSVCMPSLVTIRDREMTFVSGEDRIKDWVQSIDQWIAIANASVADAEQRRGQAREREQRGVEETRQRVTDADKYRNL